MADQSAADFLDGYTPRGATVDICQRGDLVEEIERLSAEMERVAVEDERHNREPQAPKLARRICDLEAEARRHTRRFRFAPLSHHEFSDLVAKHPPTLEQLAKARAQDAGMAWNPDTFLVALVAASSDELDDELAARAAKTLARGEWQRMWAAALAAQEAVSVPNCAAAYALAGISPTSSTTADRGEFPEASS